MAGTQRQGDPSAWEYDVFLSFRGVDTRRGFIAHLHEALEEREIKAFKDSIDLMKGESVEKLFRYIERSRMFVPVFSKRYADSKWCLKEIAKILECGRVIIPVFYDVEPSDIQHQRGSYESAFRTYQSNPKIDQQEVANWKAALNKVGEISGFSLNNDANGDQAVLKRLVLKRILNEVTVTCLSVAKHPVGLNSRVKFAMNLLETQDSDRVRIVGLCGLGGAGKTTLAKAVYNELLPKFTASSFVANVRENSGKTNGLITLQKQLLHDLLKTDTEIHSVDAGIHKLRMRIGCKPVLIVIDDVDDKQQIDALIGSGDWFDSRSKIIITSRDRSLLRGLTGDIYDPPTLNREESIELFSWHAFGKRQPTHGSHTKWIRRVLQIAGGLPLCLVVFGDHFFNLDTVYEWKEAVKKLRKYQHEKVHMKLKISYDGLEYHQKCVFLDIACFFLGRGRECATLVWKGCELYPYNAIKFLQHKSLISVDNKTGEFEMHDQIRHMGRQIVLEETRHSGKHSRLWEGEQPLEVLEVQKETEAVEGITLGPDEKTLEVLKSREGTETVEGISLRGPGKLNTKYLKEMRKLRLLRLEEFDLKGRFDRLPETLMWLQWSCNLVSLPRSFHLGKLVVLDLSCSEISRVFSRRWRISCFDRLRVLDLSNCLNLKRSPDFSIMPRLVKLALDDCWELSDLDESIGHLKKLKELSMRGCEKIRALPEQLGDLKSLEILVLDRTNVGRLPESPISLEKLSLLSLCGCRSMATLPSWIGLVKHLEELRLDDMGLTEFPDIFEGLTSLRCLQLWVTVKRASKLSSGDGGTLYRRRKCRLHLVPTFPSSLIELQCTLLGTPNTFCLDVSNLTALQKLCLWDCESLGDVLGLENLRCLQVLELIDLSGGPLRGLKVTNFVSLKRFCTSGSVSNSMLGGDDHDQFKTGTVSFLVPRLMANMRWTCNFSITRDSDLEENSFGVVGMVEDERRRCSFNVEMVGCGCGTFTMDDGETGELLCDYITSRDGYSMVHLTVSGDHLIEGCISFTGR